MKNFSNLKSAINYSLIIWFVLWLFFALFNWDIFVVRINIGTGFGVVPTSPFIIFFAIGTTLFVVLQFLAKITETSNLMEKKGNESKIELMEKNMEIMKLKEMIFKMQANDFNKNSASLNILQEKFDELSIKSTDTVKESLTEGNK